MTPQHWRGHPDEERAIDHWFRHRFAPGSIYVLDIDKLICDPSLTHGALLELKHVDAAEKNWRATRTIAQRLGWWSGLVEHDGSEPRFATFLPPKEKILDRQPLSGDHFDAWVCANFGARLAA
jgi:hypothetical protein